MTWTSSFDVSLRTISMIAYVNHVHIYGLSLKLFLTHRRSLKGGRLGGKHTVYCGTLTPHPAIRGGINTCHPLEDVRMVSTMISYIGSLTPLWIRGDHHRTHAAESDFPMMDRAELTAFSGFSPDYIRVAFLLAFSHLRYNRSPHCEPK
jgi:hypothetical protein